MRGRPASRRPLKVKMISPAKTAADSVYWRSIKYSLFPPLGLVTLAGYLDPDDEVDLQDEHVEAQIGQRRRLAACRPRQSRRLTTDLKVTAVHC